MNYKLDKIPNRTKKTRDIGLTMVMDKGLSVREAEDLVYSSSDYIDIIKLGFGTAIISKNIKKKIQLYQKNNIKVHVGGTLFEAFIIRNMFDDYIKFVEDLNLNTIEVSDGSIDLNHKIKCEYIH